MNYFLKTNLCQDANHRARATDISGEADLPTGVTSIDDIFLVEDIFSKDTQLVTNFIRFESPTCRKVAQAKSFLSEVCFIAVLKIHF